MRGCAELRPDPASRVAAMDKVPGLTLGTILACLVPAGCANPPSCDRECVSRKVEGRFGQPVGPGPRADRVLVPEGIEAGRPLAEDQAVLLALYNNAAFHEALVE